MLSTIKNLQELKAERAHLKIMSAQTGDFIKEDFIELKHALNPIGLAGDFVKNLFVNKEHGAVNDGIRNAISNVAENKLMSFLPWPVRMGASFLLKNVVSNYVYANRQTIMSTVGNTLKKIKSLTGNKTSKYKEGTYNK